MGKGKKNQAITLPPIFASEREQVRIRRKHEMPLSIDEHGRERVPTNTAEGKRLYDKSSGGIVRLRLFDPLIGIQGLSARQRNAGARYREAYELVAGAGIKPTSIEPRVDISGAPSGIMQATLDAHSEIAAANACVGHHEIARVIELVCGRRHSLREIAETTGDPVGAVAKLLRIGLDNLAERYFGRERNSARREK